MIVALDDPTQRPYRAVVNAAEGRNEILDIINFHAGPQPARGQVVRSTAYEGRPVPRVLGGRYSRHVYEPPTGRGPVGPGLRGGSPARAPGEVPPLALTPEGKLAPPIGRVATAPEAEPAQGALFRRGGA